ncbi:MAG: SDR family oxidoreductase [Lachnospiraceae bacterium]|nr:SDR family oxidoreductase [Lachnospiraceae bacterium]
MMVEKIFSLENKVTIVTGGNQGIGKVVAFYLADAGSDIVIFDLADASEVAKEIAEKYNVRTAAYVCDVTNPTSVKECIQKAADKMGKLDLLFNNAGICLHKNAIDCTPEDWLKVVNVNLNGIFFMAQAFGKYLISNNKKGNIVNTASMSGTIVNIPQGQASYNSSKAGVAHLTKSLAVEWALKGIRVNSISPGYIRTEMTGTVRQDWQDYWESTIPFRRMGTPEELAGAVIYLLSDASTYTSGSDLMIDGCFTVV